MWAERSGSWTHCPYSSAPKQPLSHFLGKKANLISGPWHNMSHQGSQVWGFLLMKYKQDSVPATQDWHLLFPRGSWEGYRHTHIPNGERRHLPQLPFLHLPGKSWPSCEWVLVGAESTPWGRERWGLWKGNCWTGAFVNNLATAYLPFSPHLPIILTFRAQ